METVGIKRMLTHCRIIFVIMAVALGILIFGCKTTTKPDPKGTINGSISLVNDTLDPSMDTNDYSGVSVSLYRTAELDTAIVRINNTFPNIGVKIDQETEFDHRLSSPVATVQTSTNGQYSFSDVAFGKYNLVMSKQDWGIQYFYEIEVLNSEAVTIAPRVIHPARKLSGYISGDYTFQAGETYLISNQLSVVGNATLEAGSKLFVDSGATITFWSDVVCSQGKSIDKYWRIDSSYGVYGNSPVAVDSTKYFTSVTFHGNVGALSDGLVRHVSDGVVFNSGQINVEQMDIKYFISGISLTNDGGLVKQTNMRNGGNKAFQCLSQTGAITINKCIVYKAYDGVVAYMSGGYTIEDNYFYGNDTAIRPQNCEGAVRYNNFYDNRCDILQYHATTEIKWNNFYLSRSVGITPRSTVTINSNNFYQTKAYFINIRRSDPPYTYVYQDLNATGNYWATTDIDRFILDGIDNESYPGAECPYSVNYLPKSNSRIAGAGIRV